MAATDSLSRWTPRRAARLSYDRVARIEHLLDEIANWWGTIDAAVVDECERIKAELKQLRVAVDRAGQNVRPSTAEADGGFDPYGCGPVPVELRDA